MTGWSRTAAIGFIGVIVGGTAAWLIQDHPQPSGWLGWALIALVIVGLLVALLGPGVRWMARAPQPTKPGEFTVKDQLDAINEVRSTILQALTGFAVVFGLVFTAVGLINTGRTLQTEQQGQITDRYTAAVDQLGSADPVVRLGGIYALERLSHDSPPDQTTIMKVLVSYIRLHARDAPPPGEFNNLLPVDVSAALKVIGERDPSHDTTGFRIDLSQVDLDGRNLEFVNLHGDNLRASDLRGADLEQGQLADTSLGLADLTGVDLRHADLNSAGLIGTRLAGADLTGVSLSHSNLNGADLVGAELSASDLAGATLVAANLSGADLHGANLTGANLTGANLTRANLDGARLKGARLPPTYSGS